MPGGSEHSVLGSPGCLIALGHRELGPFPGCLDHRGLGRAVSRVPGPQGIGEGCFPGAWTTGDWGGLFPGCLMALDHRGLGRAVSRVPDSSGPQESRFLALGHRGLGKAAITLHLSLGAL